MDETFLTSHLDEPALIVEMRIPFSSLRFQDREGNDLYLVFNEGLNTNRGRDIPYRPYYSGRAVMIKYSYTFVF